MFRNAIIICLLHLACALSNTTRVPVTKGSDLLDLWVVEKQGSARAVRFWESQMPKAGKWRHRIKGRIKLSARALMACQ